MKESEGRVTQLPTVLLVEDNPADLRLALEAMREEVPSCEILVARDGDQAIAMLRQHAPYETTRRPDLILLDLNLLRRHGLDVLGEIKRDPRLRRIPVLILTTSRAESDIAACYDAHANAYLVKPTDWSEFTELMRLIRCFWLQYVLPAAA